MRFVEWIRGEFLRVVPVFLFFFVFFLLINSTERFLFEADGLSPFHVLEIAIAAALIAKILLVIDHLFFIDFFQKRPLVVSIVWKTVVYWGALWIVRLAIRAVPVWLKGEGWALVNWNLFIAIQIDYLMLLFIFVTFRELTFKVGAKMMVKLFFGRD